MRDEKSVREMLHRFALLLQKKKGEKKAFV